MSDVIFGGDSYNAFEHALRQHVMDARELFELSCPNASTLYISYGADDGGRWLLRCYSPEVSTKGAELMRVLHAHIAAITAQEEIGVLRGLIAHDKGTANDT